MSSEVALISVAAARHAWSRLCSSGTPTREAARALSVGLDEYLDGFSTRYLGPDGGETCKLVLGANGEGKTHFLYCLRERALQQGHLVALVEAKDAGAAISPFTFGVGLIRALEAASPDEEDDDTENPVVRLLRVAVEKRRRTLVNQGLDADRLLPEWAGGFRAKNLQPNDLPRALAEGLKATIDGDVDAAVEASEKITLSHLKLTVQQQAVTGAALLTSIGRLPKMLGFQRLVLLVDEAELAIAGGGARRRNFLAFLRFVNDHVAQDGSIVLIACTDDFWPGVFQDYQALLGRLSDPGYDTERERVSLSTAALVTKQKVWVRETFRGRIEDHVRLGEAILQIGSRAHSELDLGVQHKNVDHLARVAASGGVLSFVKRPFVKALGQLVEEQVVDGKQVEIDEDEARRRFNLARKAVEEVDSEQES